MSMRKQRKMMEQSQQKSQELVEDLFTKIGKKFINPNATESGNTTADSKANSDPKGQTLTRDIDKTRRW